MKLLKTTRIKKNSNELTKREKEIISLLATGLTSKQIASQLGISYKTVDTHRMNIYAKIKIDNFADLIKYAILTGLTKCELPQLNLKSYITIANN